MEETVSRIKDTFYFAGFPWGLHEVEGTLENVYKS